ncbi:hypothetical protein PR048_004391 [Dryococelus australis]|uniref:Uncharacterized protein n=1 Tax=Dryococelus australis TaxID=614101 RepID=A0ABQ9I5B0_9NEOP|nr:hypothetical protein PR048_004391 [Dryococelus australis]
MDKRRKGWDGLTLCSSHISRMHNWLGRVVLSSTEGQSALKTWMLRVQISLKSLPNLFTHWTEGQATIAVDACPPRDMRVNLVRRDLQHPGRHRHQPLCHPIRVLRTPIGVLRTPIRVLRTPIGVLRTPIRVLRTPIGVLRTPISVLRTPIGVLRTPIRVLRTPIRVLRTPIGVLRTPISVTHTDRSVTHTYKSVTHTYRSVTHTYKCVTHTDRSVTHTYKSVTHTYKSVTHTYKCVTHTDRSVTHTYRSVTHTYKSVTHTDRSVTHTYKTVWHCSSESIVDIENSITPLDCQRIRGYVVTSDDCEASRAAERALVSLVLRSPISNTFDKMVAGGQSLDSSDAPRPQRPCWPKLAIVILLAGMPHRPFYPEILLLSHLVVAGVAPTWFVTVDTSLIGYRLDDAGKVETNHSETAEHFLISEMQEGGGRYLKTLGS